MININLGGDFSVARTNTANDYLKQQSALERRKRANKSQSKRVHNIQEPITGEIENILKK